MEYLELDREIALIAEKLSKIPFTQRMKQLKSLHKKHCDREVADLVAKIAIRPQAAMLNYHQTPNSPTFPVAV